MQKIKGTFTAPLLVLVIYVLLILSRYINLESLQVKDNIYMSLIILQVMIFMIPGVFYCKLRTENNAKNLRLTKFSARKAWFVASCFGVLVFGSTLLNTASFYLFGSNDSYSIYGTYASIGDNGWTNLVYIVITFALLPAITEEFIFRGILLSEYSSYGVSTAIILSSAMFSMLHFSLNQFFVYFFCGVVTAYAVYITQSLFAAMLLHFLNNLYAIFFESILWDVIKSPNSLIFFLFVIMTLFIVFLVLSLNGAENILYTSGVKGEQSPPEAQKREGGIKLLFEALVSPSFLGCILLYLVATLII
ncbi:MAG: CPBP family intramembrane metalloprotease [Ruminococcaceae bacterium]|nr:CPBP family intramembrane metalloprotease [Oscillospiraceae bacterium]